MSRWIASLLIAAASSLVTLLLAWSTLGPPRGSEDHAPSSSATPVSHDVKSAAAVQPASETASDDDLLQQIALLDLPDQADPRSAGRMAVSPPEQAARPHGGDHSHGPMNADNPG